MPLFFIDAYIIQEDEACWFTFPPVDFGEHRAVAAGQLGGASEWRRRQIGHQWVVTHFCQPITSMEADFNQ